MATKRIVSTSFWTDRKVDTFSPEDKYFMLYLLTNPHTTQLGIYEFSIRHAAFEMGYSSETVSALLDRFQNRYKIIMYSEESGEVAIKNYLKHSIVKGGKPVFDCLKKELSNVKSKSLIKFVVAANENSENETVFDFINHIKQTIYFENDNEHDNDNDNERIVPRIVEKSKHDEEFRKIMDLFNSVCKDLDKAKKLTEKRKRSIKKAQKDIEEFGGWEKYFAEIESSDFLTNRCKNGWRADFDWILAEKNMVKIMEGNYRNKPCRNNYSYRNEPESLEQKYEEQARRDKERIESGEYVPAPWEE